VSRYSDITLFNLKQGEGMKKFITLVILAVVCFLPTAAQAWNTGWDAERLALQRVKYDILPDTDDSRDVGSSTKEFKDGYFDGNLHVDTITFSDASTLTTATVAGDITSVWGDTTGDVSALTAASGDTLDATLADTTVPWRVNNTAAPTTEGQTIWDADGDFLAIGNGSATVYGVMDGTACTDIEGTYLSITTGTLNVSGLATLALDNLASVAINTSLVSDTAATDDLGTEAIYWRKAYLGNAISFEGSTDDAYQTTFSITDTTTADKTITFQNADGIVAMDATACTDLEGTGLSITTGTLNWASTGLTWSGNAVAHEYGGLEADVNAYSGLVAIAGGATAEVDALSELIGQIADVTAFITDDDMPAAGTDPDVDAAGEIGRDTDDNALRGFDTLNQYVYAMKKKWFSVWIDKPLNLNEADNAGIWWNKSPFNFIITYIQAESDTDDVVFTLVELDDARDFTDTTTIEAVTISTDGTNVYYANLGQDSIAFTSGGTAEIAVGDVVTCVEGGETAIVEGISALSSGSWAGGDAAGTLYLSSVSGVFQAGELSTPTQANIATVGGDTTVVIDHTVIEPEHGICVNNDAADDPDSLGYTIVGYFDGDKD
jgi:hypothetical protein